MDCAVEETRRSAARGKDQERVGCTFILKRCVFLTYGRKLLECVAGEAQWKNEFVVQSGSRWRHVRDCVGPSVTSGLLIEELLGGIWLSWIVHRYHDLSLLSVIGERVQAVFVGHGEVCDPDVSGIVEAWEDLWFLKSKHSCSTRRYDC